MKKSEAATIRPFQPETDRMPVIGLLQKNKMYNHNLDSPMGQGPNDIFVAEIDGELIGSVYVNGPMIRRLVVEEAHRRNGTGTALMHAALEKLERRGVAVAEIQTAEDSNLAGFYERLGFKRSYKVVGWTLPLSGVDISEVDIDIPPLRLNAPFVGEYFNRRNNPRTNYVFTNVSALSALFKESPNDDIREIFLSADSQDNMVITATPLIRQPEGFWRCWAGPKFVRDRNLLLRLIDLDSRPERSRDRKIGPQGYYAVYAYRNGVIPFRIAAEPELKLFHDGQAAMRISEALLGSQ